MYRFLILTIFLSGCSQTSSTEWAISFEFLDKNENTSSYISHAENYIGMDEIASNKELKFLMGIDPISIQWCAAFVNAVLDKSDIEGSESVSNYPLLARSFLNWGEKADVPKKGDIVVFPRGNQGWQGHVGFYVDTVLQDGVEYYIILGGNQDDRVSYDLYLADSALSVRKMAE